MAKGGGSLGDGRRTEDEVPSVPDPESLGPDERNAQQLLRSVVDGNGGRFGFPPDVPGRIPADGIDIGALTDFADSWIRSHSADDGSGGLRHSGQPGLWHCFDDLYPLQHPDRWNKIRSAVADELLFGLEDASGDVLAMFILAQFDWGFEGTYTIVNSLLPRRQTTGAARLLMLLSNALVLARHGSGTLLYGEANVYNIRACISAGYEIVRPHFSPRLHENVVWRDNPIGKLVDTHNELRGPPPGYRDQLYVDYALMRAKNEVILPFSSAAQHFAGMS